MATFADLLLYDWLRRGSPRPGPVGLGGRPDNADELTRLPTCEVGDEVVADLRNFAQSVTDARHWADGVYQWRAELHSRKFSGYVPAARGVGRVGIRVPRRFYHSGAVQEKIGAFIEEELLPAFHGFRCSSSADGDGTTITLEVPHMADSDEPIAGFEEVFLRLRIAFSSRAASGVHLVFPRHVYTTDSKAVAFGREEPVMKHVGAQLRAFGLCPERVDARRVDDADVFVIKGNHFSASTEEAVAGYRPADAVVVEVPASALTSATAATSTV